MAGIVLSTKETNIWRIVQAVIQLLNGRSNSVGVVTLRAGQTTTVVDKSVSVGAVNVSTSTQIFLTPKTANAAAVVGTTYIQAADIGLGTFTITHANSANTDQTFGFEARG